MNGWECLVQDGGSCHVISLEGCCGSKVVNPKGVHCSFLVCGQAPSETHLNPVSGPVTAVSHAGKSSCAVTTLSETLHHALENVKLLLYPYWMLLIILKAWQ